MTIPWPPEGFPAGQMSGAPFRDEIPRKAGGGKATMTAEGRPGQIVVHLKWTEDGEPQQKTFGPWTPAGDDAHLGPITAFMRDWSRIAGDGAREAVMEMLLTEPVTVTDPGEWVRQREDGNDD